MRIIDNPRKVRANPMLKAGARARFMVEGWIVYPIAFRTIRVFL
jgi:hypothetical protein